MELLIPHECSNCGAVDEARLIFSGPHIKQVCNGCGSYVKFISKGAVPDHRETKLKIWSITTDIHLINKCKSEIGFVDHLKGIELKISYWRLYLQVRKSVLSNQLQAIEKETKL